MAISKDEDGWTGELRTVGEPKVMKDLRYADGKLSFSRALRIGTPEYPGGPYTGEREMRDLEATAQGDSIKVRMKVPEVKPFVHFGKRLPPDPIFPK